MTPRQAIDPSEGSPQKKNIPSACEGLRVERVFSTEGEHPFDQIEWQKRTARIGDDKGGVVFEQEGVEVPSTWSQLAVNVVASKYFYGDRNKPQRENSIRQLVHRVTRTIADWGRQDGLFASQADADRFYDELTYLCVNQYGSFNSPVWFNVGLFQQLGVTGSEGNFHWDAAASGPVRTLRGYEYPQASACFIQSVDDTMEDIMRLATAEAMLFKYGSGTGTDLSTLRSSKEKLSGGGTPSGPLSFMRIYDQIAAVVRSGGKTRRAAKMQSLRCDHPDIKDFIECKMKEEKKAWALIEQGYDGSFNGDAYASVMYQNANLSVRISDEFMKAALDAADWQTYAVTSGTPLTKYKADELLGLIAEGTWICGDPGVQYHTTINRWHTCPNSGPINASNPCSEYMFVNDSACNLASLNLMKFRNEDGTFDTDRFRVAARLFVIAQEILVDHASYPTDRICRNSHDFRPLGLGFANLGSLIMSLGLPYDGDNGRSYAAAIGAVMTATAYSTSAELASRLGTFTHFNRNRQPMLQVMRMHRDAAGKIASDCPEALRQAASTCWDQAIAAGERHGYRNAQTTVLAPTGTIGFMMDCDTTGIEPDIALVKYKLLAGGGMFKIVNRTLPLALQRLGYSPVQVHQIVEYVEENDTIEGAPALKDDHLPVFDCAFKPAKGSRCIHPMGHIRMMAAVQPFISGAISKTVNMSKETTVAEIRQAYIDSWKLGLKAVAIYRDGSKRTQPLNTGKTKTPATAAAATTAVPKAAPADPPAPYRRRMATTGASVRHKFNVANHEGYLHVGLFEDGKPGELFITMAKEGSTVGGMMDAFATSISLCLQYGVPLDALVKKFSHQRFEPSGMTDNRDIPMAKSIVDYIFRWLGMSFLEEFRKANALPRGGDSAAPKTPVSKAAPGAVKEDEPSETGSADRAFNRDGGRSIGTLIPPPPRTTGGSGANGGSASGTYRSEAAAVPAEAVAVRAPASTVDTLSNALGGLQEDAPPCDVCGTITVRNGSCYKCMNCGSSLGCS